MPLLPVSVAPRIAPSARAEASSVTAVLVLSGAALVAVVVGFGLVATSLIGWSSMSPLWGLGVACAGLVAARAARERAPRLRS